MDKVESTRSKQIAGLIQSDISDIFLKECRDLVNGALVSVTVVRMSPDFELARIYLSVFPFDKSNQIVEKIRENSSRVRHALGKRMRNNLRVIPEVAFFVDDSMEYAANINRVMDGIVITPESEDDDYDDVYIK